MARIVEKDPDSDLTITLDWTNQLDGATIVGSTWTLPTGITETLSSYSSTTTTLQMGGGTAGTTYELENDITRSAGAAIDANVYVHVKQQVLDEVRRLPLTLAELKHSMRITTNDDDQYLIELLAAAVEYVETATGRDLMRNTTTILCPKFPSDGFEFELVPVRALARIRYYDSDNVIQTLAASTYSVYTRPDGSTIVQLAINQSWPATANRDDAVELLISSGYADADTVPALATMAIRRYCRLLYDNPGVMVADDRTLTSMIWSLKTGNYASI